MTAAAIRNKLHRFIETIEDKQAKAIYTLFEDKIEEAGNEEYTDAFKAELDQRYDAYKKDGKTLSREAVDKRVKKLVNKAK